MENLHKKNKNISEDIKELIEMANREPKLSLEQEIELTKLINTGNMASKETAKYELAHANERMAMEIFKTYRRCNDDIPDTELIHGTMSGLFYAVETYDYKKGQKFADYATAVIKTKMCQYLERQGYNVSALKEKTLVKREQSNPLQYTGFHSKKENIKNPLKKPAALQCVKKSRI